MSPCGGECRVGRSRCRAVARRRRRTPAPAPRRRGADPRHRRGADPRHRQRHQQTIATNKRSTSAAARRPPAAAQSAAQAAGAARAPRRSISHAHRSPQARAGQSERCHKPPSTQLFEPGCCRTPPPSSRRQRRALARARAKIRRERVNAGYAILRKPPLLPKYPVALRSPAIAARYRSGSGKSAERRKMQALSGRCNGATNCTKIKPKRRLRLSSAFSSVDYNLALPRPLGAPRKSSFPPP